MKNHDKDKSGRPQGSTTYANSQHASAQTQQFQVWSPNKERAQFEKFGLVWAIVWIGIMCVIVVLQLFEGFTPWHYLAVGITFVAVPVMYPILFPAYFTTPESSNICFWNRYTTKANLYIFLLSWNANYFWTHYFYVVLKTSYTFNAHRFNDVPFGLYLMTHSYFLLYHVAASICIRYYWNIWTTKLKYFFDSKPPQVSPAKKNDDYNGNGNTLEHTNSPYSKSRIISFSFSAISLIIFCYFVAFMETFTIQNFPYYHIPDRFAMYVYGSLFYSLYFVVSFPFFHRMDEYSNQFSFFQAFVEAQGCSMIITQLLDFWRLGIGSIISEPALNAAPPKTVPYVY